MGIFQTTKSKNYLAIINIEKLVGNKEMKITYKFLIKKEKKLTTGTRIFGTSFLHVCDVKRKARQTWQ